MNQEFIPALIYKNSGRVAYWVDNQGFCRDVYESPKSYSTLREALKVFRLRYSRNTTRHKINRNYVPAILKKNEENGSKDIAKSFDTEETYTEMAASVEKALEVLGKDEEKIFDLCYVLQFSVGLYLNKHLHTSLYPSKALSFSTIEEAFDFIEENKAKIPGGAKPVRIRKSY